MVIAKAGKPLVRLIPYEEKKPVIFGTIKGQIEISEDFDEYSGETAEMFMDYDPDGK